MTKGILLFGGIGENLDSVTRTSTRDQGIKKATEEEFEQIQAWLELWVIACDEEKERRGGKW